MNNPVWQSMRKHKLSNISLAAVIAIGMTYGVLIASNNRSSDAATSFCYGNAGTHTAAAPSSVNPGQTFKITNITGFANTNIATVNSTTLTFAVTGATPTAPSESWNGGPVHGDYEADYPDLTLTATGSVGSQITFALASIEAHITIGASNPTITCSVSNGQLTANNPGQSLTIATINIVAPPKKTTSSGTKKTTATTPSTSSKTTTPSKTTPTSPTIASPEPVATDSSADNQTTVDTNVFVKDFRGQPIKNARVVLDSMPPVLTDSSGKASFSKVSIGQHDLSVYSNGKTITQVLKIDPQSAGKVLGVSVQMPKPSHKLRNIIAAIVIAFLGLQTAGFILVSWLMKKKPVSSVTAPLHSGPALDTINLVAPQVISPQAGNSTSPAGPVVNEGDNKVITP